MCIVLYFSLLFFDIYQTDQTKPLLSFQAFLPSFPIFSCSSVFLVFVIFSLVFVTSLVMLLMLCISFQLTFLFPTFLVEPFYPQSLWFLSTVCVCVCILFDCSFLFSFSVCLLLFFFCMYCLFTAQQCFSVQPLHVPWPVIYGVMCVQCVTLHRPGLLSLSLPLLYFFSFISWIS